MRKLLILVVAAAALWSGYWFIGARAAETAIRGWLEARSAEGWIAEWDGVRTRGFPNRFDTTISNLELADPETGVAWRAPFFQIFALSYRPNHIIAVWPGEQTIASPYQNITVRADEMKGSVVFRPGTSLTLDRSAFVLDGFRLTSNAGWTAEMANGRFATRRTAATEFAHDIGLEASGVTPSAELRAALDPAGLLPAVIDTLRLDVTLDFDAPWDRAALEEARPAITGVDLAELRAQWGKLELRAAGELSVDDVGVPEGRITVKAVNWREMLGIAVAAGMVPEGLEITAERALEVLASLSGKPDTLDAPLTFKNGNVAFGPIPIGRAPRLVIR